VNWKKILLANLAIILLSAVVTVVIFLSEPEATRSTATRKTAMLVDVVNPEYGTFRPSLRTMGTVVPEKEIVLRPQVGGKVVFLSENLTPGGFVEKDEVLLRIERADYEAEVLERRSALLQAEAELQLEMGRQDVAKMDYELLGEDLAPSNRSLVLREPQLSAAEARVQAERAALRRAELDLERTVVRAPFTAQVISRSTNLGALLAGGEAIAELVGVEAYWLEATLPVAQLRWIEFPKNGEDEGPKATIGSRFSPEEKVREGTVHRLIASLEGATRLARILITIPDPLHRETNGEIIRPDEPPLMVGGFLEARIEGRVLEDVYRLDRSLLRQNETVWLKEEGKLKIRPVEVILRNEDYVYIREGLSPDAQVVTTNLSTVVEGSDLRIEESAQ